MQQLISAHLVLSIIVTFGSCLAEFDSRHQHEFFEACSKGNNTKIRSLVLSGLVPVNAISQEKIRNDLWQDGDTCLIVASSNGKTSTVEMLLREFDSSRKRINEQNTRGRTALHEAAYNGHVNIVKLLCDVGGADLEKKEKLTGHTAFTLAAKVHRNNQEVVQFLLKRGADVMARTTDGQTALDLANTNNVKTVIKSHIIPMLKKLFKACYQGDTKEVHLLLSAKPKWASAMCLIITAWRGKAETAEMVINEFKPNVNEQVDTNGFTALHEAASHGHAEILQLLCEVGKADLEIRTNDRFGRKTALTLAAEGRHDDIVKYLLKKGASKAGKEKEMFAACFKGVTSQVRALLNGTEAMLNVNALFDIDTHGAEAEYETWWQGRSCLMLAASNGKSETVQMLIEQFKNVNVDQQHDGAWRWTALHHAAKRGNVDVVRLLCEIGNATLDKIDANGQTALMIGAYFGNCQAVDYLVKKGANVSLKDLKGRTAVNMTGNEKIKQLLLKNEVNC